MPVYAFEGQRPDIDPSAYIAPTATVIGRVRVGPRCYVGPGAILRGDYGAIEIGEETAVEEGVIVHARPDDRTVIERRVTLGHGALVHNATVREGAVIGMRAVVADFAEVGAGALVGAMTLVKERQQIPSGVVAVGVPARVVGPTDERHRLFTHRAKDLYVDLAGRYAAGGLVEIDRGPARGPVVGPLIAIGTIRTPFRTPTETPVQGSLAPEAEGTVEVHPGFVEGLADLAGFSHVVLVYWFDRIDGFALTVKPYLDDARRGLFATRAPCRPNRIGLTVVRLLAVDGPRLRVAGVDMLDGTPLLDIKPYVQLFDGPTSTSHGWFDRRLAELGGGKAAPRADGRFHGAGLAGGKSRTSSRKVRNGRPPARKTTR